MKITTFICFINHFLLQLVIILNFYQSKCQLFCNQNSIFEKYIWRASLAINFIMKALLISFQTTFFQEQTIITLVQTLPILNQNKQQNMAFQQASQIKSVRSSSDFYEAVCCIIKILTKQSLQLRNIPIIPLQKNYLQILRAQCERRRIDVPILMLNIINIHQIFKLEFGISINHLKDMIKFLRIENDYDDKLLILKQIWKKLEVNCNIIKYIKRETKLFSSLFKNQSVYFKVSGFPVTINRKQILDYFSLQEMQIQFIYKNTFFSGILIFKVQFQFLDYFQKRIQFLYSPSLQIQKIGKIEYETIISNQQCRTNTYQKQKTIKQEARQLRERSRSKDNFQIQQYMCSIRLRGLPFHIQKNDIYKIFKGYRVIKQSIKLGHRNGRKSGQAMITFRQKQSAIKALQEDGTIIMNRYLQLKLCSIQQYKRFK